MSAWMSNWEASREEFDTAQAGSSAAADHGSMGIPSSRIVLDPSPIQHDGVPIETPRPLHDGVPANVPVQTPPEHEGLLFLSSVSPQSLSW